MDEWRQRRGIDKCSKSPGLWRERLRIGQHVNLNPFRERRKHTGRENKGLSGKESDVRSLSSPQSFIPSVCDQPVAGSSREIPPYLSEASLLITAFISLGSFCRLALCYSFLLTSSLLNVILPNIHWLDSVISRWLIYGWILFLLHFSLLCQWLTCF